MAAPAFGRDGDPAHFLGARPFLLRRCLFYARPDRIFRTSPGAPLLNGNLRDRRARFIVSNRLQVEA